MNRSLLTPVCARPIRRGRSEIMTAYGGSTRPRMPMPEPTSVVEGSISTADLALLCAFGIGSEPVRSRKQLRQALLLAGYSGSQVVHLIKTSPLLVRADARHHYRLRASKRASRRHR